MMHDSDTSIIRRVRRIHDMTKDASFPREIMYNMIGQVLLDMDYRKWPMWYRVPRLFRAVSSPDENWFDNVDKFFVVPKEVAQLNRCSWKGEPMFYGSNDNGVPFFEIKAKPNDYVVLSVYVSNKNAADSEPDIEDSIPIKFFGLSLGVKRMIEMISDQDSPLKQLLYQDDIFSDDTPQIIKEFDDYLGEIFGEVIPDRERHLYSMTSSFCKVIQEQIRIRPSIPDGSPALVIDGFLYPSVASDMTGFNTSLSEDFVRNNLRLLSASMYKIIDYDNVNKAYSIQPIKSLCHVDSEGIVKWRKVADNHKNDIWPLSPQSPSINGPNKVLDLEDDCV